MACCTPDKPDASSTKAKAPTSPGVCAIDPADGQTPITAAIAGCPDGSTVRFPTKRQYTQNGAIHVVSRHNLTIDGNGSTFTSTAPNDNSKFVPNWQLRRNTNFTLKNANIVGNFHDRGVPDGNRGANTVNSGVLVFGGDGTTLSDLAISDVWGDGVTLLTTWIVEGGNGPGDPARNVHMNRLTINTTGRHGLAISQGVGVWLEDSTLTRAFYSGIDVEKDRLDDAGGDVHILRNSFSDFHTQGLNVPVGGTADNPLRNIEIRGNRFTTLAVAGACNQAIGIGGYEGQFMADVVIEDNLIVAWRTGVLLIRVMSGSVSRNKIERLGPPGECGAPDTPVEARVSPGVIVNTGP